MSQVATSEIKQPKKRGRPRKFSEGSKSCYFKSASSAATKDESSSCFSPTKHPLKTSKFQDWHNKSDQEKKKHYRLTSGLKKFVSSCTPISVELWEAFRVDHRNTCGLCGSIVEGTDVLKEHILNHVHLKCLSCNAFFNKLDSFKSHVQLHSPVKSKSCKFDGGVLPCSSQILNRTNSGEFTSSHNVESMIDEQLNAVQDEDEWDSCGIREAMNELLKADESIGVSRSMPDLDFEEEELVTKGYSSGCLDKVLDELHQGTENTTVNNRVKECDFEVPNIVNAVPNTEKPVACLDEALSMQIPEKTSQNESTEGLMVLDIPHSSPGLDAVPAPGKPIACFDEVQSVQLADNSSKNNTPEGCEVSDMIYTSSTSKTTTSCSKSGICIIDANDMDIIEKCPPPSQESDHTSEITPVDHASYLKSGKGARKEIIELDSESENSIAGQQFASSNIETIICDDSSDGVVFVDGTFKVPKPIKSAEFDSRFFGKSENKETLEMLRFPAPFNLGVSQSIIISDDEIDHQRFSVATNQTTSQTISLLDDEIENEVINDLIVSDDSDLEVRLGPESKPVGSGKKSEVSETVFKELPLDGIPAKNPQCPPKASAAKSSPESNTKQKCPSGSGKKSGASETVSKFGLPDENAKRETKASIKKCSPESKLEELHYSSESGNESELFGTVSSDHSLDEPRVEKKRRYTKRSSKAPTRRYSSESKKPKCPSGSGKKSQASERVSKFGLPAENAKCETKASIKKCSPKSKLEELHYSSESVNESELFGTVSSDHSLDEQGVEKKRRYTKRSSKAPTRRYSSESKKPKCPSGSGKKSEASERVSKLGLPAENAKCETKASIKKCSPKSKLEELYYSSESGNESEVFGTVSSDHSSDEQRIEKRRRCTKRSSKAPTKRYSSESNPKPKCPSGSRKKREASERVSNYRLPAKCETKASIEKCSPESKFEELYYSSESCKESEVKTSVSKGTVSNDHSLDEQRVEKKRRCTKRSSKAPTKRSSSEASHPSRPKAPVNITNELPIDEPPAKKRKRSNKSAKRRKGRVSKNELNSLFSDLPKSLVDIVPVTPSTDRRVTRRSVSSGAKSNTCKTLSSSPKKPKVPKIKNRSDSSEVDFLTRLYVEKNGNVPTAASIKIEMMESQTSRSHKKKTRRVPRTIISGKDFKSFSWVVPFSSTPSYLANDRQWKKLLDVAKASKSSPRLSGSGSDSDFGQKFESVSDDVSKSPTKPAELDTSMAGLTNFEVVDVGNVSECSFANDSPSRDKDPLDIVSEDTLESDHLDDESGESLAAPNIVHPSAKVSFDREKFIARSASTSTILMDDIPELVDGQWFVRYIVYYRLNNKVDRIMAFPNKESFFFGCSSDKMEDENIPKDRIIEESYFCDYRSGNNITIRLGEPLTKVGSDSSNPTFENTDGIVPKNGNTGNLQRNDISRNLNQVEIDAIRGERENGSCSVDVENRSTSADCKEKMTLEMKISASNEVQGKLVSSTVEPNDEDNTPLKDRELNSNIATDEGGTSPVLVTRNIKTVRPIGDSSNSGYWGFSDSESDTEKITINTPKSPDRGKPNTDKVEFSDETDEEYISGVGTNGKNGPTPWEQLAKDLKNIDEEVPLTRSRRFKPRKIMAPRIYNDFDIDTPPDSVGDNIEYASHLHSDLSSHDLHISGSRRFGGVYCSNSKTRLEKSSFPLPGCSSESSGFKSSTGSLSERFSSYERGRSRHDSRRRPCLKKRMEWFDTSHGHDELLDRSDCSEDYHSDHTFCLRDRESCSSGSLSPDHVDDIILQSGHSSDGTSYPDPDQASRLNRDCSSPPLLHGSPPSSSSSCASLDHFANSRGTPLPSRRFHSDDDSDHSFEDKYFSPDYSDDCDEST